MVVKTFLIGITTLIVLVILIIEILAMALVACIPIALAVIILGIDSPLWYAK